MKVALPASDAAYGELLREIKSCVRSARLGAARAVNRAQLTLYWELGRLIAERQEVQGWGQSVVERLSTDLRAAFPDMTGFSPQNLWLMRQLFIEYRVTPNLQQLVGEIPWGQNLLITYACFILGAAPGFCGSPAVNRPLQAVAIFWKKLSFPPAACLLSTSPSRY